MIGPNNPGAVLARQHQPAYAATGPARPYRGAGGPRRAVRRELLTRLVITHLSAYPQSWFSAYELARVIRQSYLKEPPLPRSRYGYGRANVLAAILRDLRDGGRVDCRQGCRAGTTVWRIRTPDRVS